MSVFFLGAGKTALAATFEITEMSCMTSPGGYWWAIEQANASPGRDTIQVRKSFTVDDCNHFPADQYPDLHVTESVDIVGNGFTVYGNVGFVDANGMFNRHGVCPISQNGYLTVGYGGGFIDIGSRNVDNLGIEVTVNGLNMSRLTGVAMVRKNAKLKIENSHIQDIYSVYHLQCNEPIIMAQDHSDLTLVNTKFERISVPEEGYPDTAFPVATSAIKGIGGNLVMDRVTMDGVYGDHTTAIGWFNGTAKIVSSQFVNSSGIWVESGALDFVNSSYVAGIAGLEFKDNILLGNVTAKFQASTFWWGAWGDPCDPVSRPCAPRILGFDAVGSSIRFEGSAIGAWELDSYPVLTGNPGQFSSDTYTWIQPRTRQTAAAIQAILPNALTAPPGLHDFPSFDTTEYLRDITPLVPGLLVEAVPNAGPGGVNRLISPIDGLPIATDVLGNRRRYSNDTRNIGAVQNAEAPVLKATGGDAKADLSWNNPTGTKTGYEICTSSTVLSDPFTGSCTGTSTSVSDPTKTAQSIGSLTNGSPYWFVIRSVNGGTPGIWSNVATATPSWVPGTPVVTAIPSDGETALSWTTPSDNGSPITGYVVKYRQQGSPTWTSWVFSGTGTSTTINSLMNGATYEFEVSALNGSPADIGLGQGQGYFGVTSATPAKPLGLAYPTPIEAYQGFPQTISPALSNLLGTPTYSLFSGSLPSGMSLNPDGTISGTPGAGSGSAIGIPYTVTIQLSQSGPPTQTITASLTITVVTVPPALQLIYPDLLNVPVGSGPYSLSPSTTGFTGPITYSVVDGSLPPGLSLDPVTGIISGTPITATSGVFTPTIRAEYPGQNPAQIRQNILEIEILPLLSYPPVNPTLGTPFTITPSTSPAISIGTYSVIAGTLPPGLILDSTTGQISGTPTSLISSNVTIEFTTGLQTVQANVLIAIQGYPITLSYPPTAVTIGRPVNLTPSTTGMKGNLTYSLMGGSLPPGLTLNPNTGVISGTPTGPAGNYPVVIKVSDPYTSTNTPLVFVVSSAPPPPQPIPTLGEWGAMIMALMMLLIGCRRLLER
jgi:hypothetical protein